MAVDEKRMNSPKVTAELVAMLIEECEKDSVRVVAHRHGLDQSTVYKVLGKAGKSRGRPYKVTDEELLRAYVDPANKRIKDVAAAVGMNAIQTGKRLGRALHRVVLAHLDLGFAPFAPPNEKAPD